MLKQNPKRVVVTGPESSGKTTLTSRLAARFAAVWTPEYARDYLPLLGRPYEEYDLLSIAQGQWLWERYASYWARQKAERHALLFCDTSLEVIKVWSDYRYGRTHPWIEDRLFRDRPALYLLCRPDLPWEFDPLRENPDDRETLFGIYEKELRRLEAPYVIIGGSDAGWRLDQAAGAIGALFL